MTPAVALKVSPEPDDDPTFYPEVDNVGEDVVQRLVAEALRPLIQRYLDARGDIAFVGADQFMYYIKGNPRACTSPDVYVLPGIKLSEYRRIGSWKMWQTHNPPSLAIEIMSESDDQKKDEEKSPLRHDVMGTKELVVFDPYVDELSGRTRFRVFRRNHAGRLKLVLLTNVDRVWSETLGCFLRAVGVSNDVRLRLALGPEGDALFPTEAEAQTQRADEAAKLARDEAQRADEAAKLARDAAQRAHDEAQRADEAEAELARLRAELAALKKQS